jgi:hypothetical protein
MGGACSTNRGYWWESQKERDHSKDQDIGGWRRKLSIALFGELSLEEDMHLSQDRLLLD